VLLPVVVQLRGVVEFFAAIASVSFVSTASETSATSTPFVLIAAVVAVVSIWATVVIVVIVSPVLMNSQYCIVKLYSLSIVAAPSKVATFVFVSIGIVSPVGITASATE
jgi:hypothetical protein